MNFSKNKNFAMFITAIIGLGISILLFHLYMQSNYNPTALASFCSINEVVDCDGVERSMLAQVFGIPFACWGMIIYSVMIILLFADKLKNIKFLGFFEVFKNPTKYVSAIGYIAFTLSLVLAITAYVQIKKVCIVCALTYVCDITIALLGTNFKNGGIADVFKTSIDDFISAVKIPKYGISFAICTLAVASFLYYTTSSFVFVPHLQIRRDAEKFQKLVKDNPYKVYGNTLGSHNPKLIVEIYTDYECPMCKINNVMLHKVVKELNGIKVVHKNFPLDIECNKNLQHPFHQNACLYARYSIAAEKQGKWGQMNNLLFSVNPQSERTILYLARRLHFDTQRLQQDANSDETNAQIQKEIQEGMANRVVGTPMLIINKDNRIEGLRPYNELKKTLKKALKEAKANGQR